jgi:endonuclease/exonuclease/phosphatase (EEP) superfamily protein YafD
MFFKAFLVLSATGLALASLAAFAPRSFFLTDLLSHFVLHYGLAALCLAVLTALVSRDTASVYVLCTATLLACALQLRPMLGTAPPSDAGAGAARLKILQANILFLNADMTDLVNLIATEHPDIIVINEANSAFATAATLIPGHPHRKIKPQDGTADGIAVLSRHPFEAVEVLNLSRPASTSIALRIRIGNRPLDILAVHPANPLRDFRARDAEYAGITRWITAEDRLDALVVGDFNATPYSAVFKNLLKSADLKNARAGQGILGSYPAWLPSPLRIPIDHVVTRGAGRIADMRLGPDIGSDHLPVITTIVF